MTTEQVPSNQWNTPWRASGFAVYDTSGNLVAHTGITGNRSMHGKQLELMAAMIAEAVNAYSAGEPPVVCGPELAHAMDKLGAIVNGQSERITPIEANALLINWRQLQSDARAAQPPSALRPGLERAVDIVSAIEAPSDYYEPFKSRLIDALQAAVYSSETKSGEQP